MKTLQSFALYALVAPAITLGAGSVLAQQQTDQDADRGAQSSERDYGPTGYSDRDSERDAQRSQRDRGAEDYSDSESAAQRERGDREFGMDGGAGQQDQGSQQAGDLRESGDDLAERKGFLDSAPADGMKASNIIGSDIKTSGDEKKLGSVDDLILNEDGQVVAIVVGVGGFLGMGQKDVAINWGYVTMSGTGDDQQLSVDVTRDELRNAPKFERRD